MLIWWGSKKTKRVKEVTDRLTMVLAAESSATSTGTAGGAAIVLRAKEQPFPVHSESVVAEDGISAPPAHASSRPASKLRSKDYADTTVTSADITPTIEAATPSVAIVDEMFVPPAEHHSVQ